MNKICILLFFLFNILILKGQDIIIYGIIKDSITKNNVSETTVSIMENGKIAHIQLTKNDGSFKFKIKKNNEKNIVLQTNHLSYKTKQITIYRKSDTIRTDIFVYPKINTIEEIEINPPILIKGDTIEFNANVFNLDSTMVVEDLFYRLPGIIVWGDGKVTYNGKQIKSLLVNNKEFFSKDFKVAIQNIPNFIVDKVQIYDNRDEILKKKKPNDQSYEVNIKIKPDKEKMYFGLIGINSSFFKRNDMYNVINYSDKKIQLSGGLTFNNTNKNINSLDQLIINTTYKPGEISKSYNQDFFYIGLKKQKSIGAQGQYDFLKEPNNQKKNNIKISSYYWNNIEENQDSTISYINDINKNNFEKFRVQENFYNKNSVNRDYNIQYIYENKNLNNKGMLQNIFFSYKRNVFTEQSSSRYIERLEEKTNLNILNDISTDDATNGGKNIFQFNSKFKFLKDKNSKKYLLNIYIKNDIKYDVDESLSKKMNPYSFIEYTNQEYRQYSSSEKHLHGHTNLFIDGLDNLFIKQNKIWRLKLEIINRASIKKYGQETNDILSDSSKYRNPTLTYNEYFKNNIINTNIINEFKIWHYEIPMHSSRNLFLEVKSGIEHFIMKNNSSIENRNINKEYSFFIPIATINYQFRKPNRYGSISLGSLKDRVYYGINQISPIYDNIDNYNIYKENLNLHNSDRSGYELNYSEILKNKTLITSKIQYLNISKEIIDSIITDNKRNYYKINSEDQSNLLSTSFSLVNPFYLNKQSNITLSYNFNFDLITSFYYLNKNIINYKRYYLLNEASIYYFLIDKLKVGFEYKNNYHRKIDQLTTNETSEIASIINTNTLKFSYFLNKSINITTDLNHKRNQISSNKSSIYIWNTELSLRLTKKKNLEFGVSIFDILNQNRGIYTYQTSNEMSITTGTTLKRFFTFNIKYYPRLFK